MRNRHPIPIAATVLCLALAACAGDGGDGSAESSDGLQPLTIGITGLTTNAPLYIAQEQGWFEDEGLEVSIEILGGGAAAVPALSSGEVQVGAGNLVSIMQAVEQGIPLQALTGINVAPESEQDTGHLTSALLVEEGSSIATAADLADATVAINDLGGLGDVTIKATVANDGGDPNAIQFTELAFPDMLPAAEDGQVDVIWLVEPFVSQATDRGMKVIAYNFYEAMPGLPLGVYFTTPAIQEDYAAELDIFTEVMDRASGYALDNEDEVRAIVPTFTAVPEEAAEVMALPVITSTIPRERIEGLAEIALEYDLISEMPDLDSIFESVYPE